MSEILRAGRVRKGRTRQAETHEQELKFLYTGRISFISQRSFRPTCRAFQQIQSGLARLSGEGNGTLLQYSCLENPMEGGAWQAAIHEVTKSQTWRSDFTFTFHFSLSCIGEGNGNPLQYSCLENSRDGGAWWAAVYGVAQSQTRLK